MIGKHCPDCGQLPLFTDYPADKHCRVGLPTFELGDIVNDVGELGEVVEVLNDLKMLEYHSWKTNRNRCRPYHLVTSVLAKHGSPAYHKLKTIKEEFSRI